MSVVSARAAINALLERMEASRLACEAALAVSAVFGREHVTLMRDALFEEDDEDSQGRVEDEVFEAERLVGTPVPILSPLFLKALVPTGFVGRNIRHGFEEIARLSRTTAMPDPNRAEPSTEGWSPSELAVVAGALRRRAERLTHALRDINTNANSLILASVFLVRRPQLPGGGPGRVQIMTHEYLDSKIGAPLTAELLGHLVTIRRVSDPLPGEPETLRHFGSHLTNRIRLELVAFPRITPADDDLVD